MKQIITLPTTSGEGNITEIPPGRISEIARRISELFEGHQSDIRLSLLLDPMYNDKLLQLQKGCGLENRAEVIELAVRLLHYFYTNHPDGRGFGSIDDSNLEGSFNELSIPGFSAPAKFSGRELRALLYVISNP